MNADGWPASPQLDLAPGQVISGKAFSLPFRILALLLVEGVAWWGYVLWNHGKLGTSVTTSKAKMRKGNENAFPLITWSGAKSS